MTNHDHQSKGRKRRAKPRAIPQRDVHVRVWGKPREPADLRKLSRALLALAQTEADARAAHTAPAASDDGLPEPKEAA